VLWKNPADLTVHQQAELQWIAVTDPRLCRAYLRQENPFCRTLSIGSN
jgi:hypothetical protein